MKKIFAPEWFCPLCGYLTIKRPAHGKCPACKKGEPVVYKVVQYE